MYSSRRFIIVNGPYFYNLCNLVTSLINPNEIRKFYNRLIGVVMLILLISPGNPLKSADSLEVKFNKNRLGLITASGGIIYGGTMIGLSQAWYRHYEQTSFQFFNDNAQWLQMDKVGHAMTSYYIGRMGIAAMKWTGTKRKKAVWYGMAYGLVFQTTIEVMDAHSEAWGFSLTDMASNMLGSAFLVSQELLWDEQRITFKFSARPTDYAQYRPEVLGNGWQEAWLKDYNGQSYWLSANPASFMKSKPNWFPGWLNIAAGYSVDGVVGGISNPTINEAGEIIPVFERQRQFYLSFDVDLTRIPTESKVLKTCFELFSFIKIPAPAVEFNQNGKVRLYGLYY
jgi:uncharacterized protein YfiM (DUF2279 family)